MSMNADFFHPTWEGRKCVTVNYDRMDSLDGYWDGAEFRDAIDIDGHHQPGQEITDGAGDLLGDDINQIAYRESVESFAWAMAPGPQRRLSLPNLSNGRARHPRSIAYHPSLRRGAPSSSPASDVRLDVYSCATANLKSDNELNGATSVAIGRIRSRCQRYQQRLDALLTKSFDALPFQECLLDFWDEILPITAGIHFFNRQAPVPRMSLLHEFVRTPIPKALGTMQCEIERVKITGKDSKAAAKRVKGHFFPKYEYLCSSGIPGATIRICTHLGRIACYWWQKIREERIALQRLLRKTRHPIAEEVIAWGVLTSQLPLGWPAPVMAAHLSAE